jgi:hypothetical protein
VTVAIVSTLCGEVLCRQFQLSPWIGLLAGAVILFLIVLIVGRRSVPVAIDST